MPNRMKPLEKLLRFEVVLGLFLIANARDCAASDWPRFLGPDGNNISPETGLLEAWGAKGVPILWDKQVGSGYSAPSVLGQRLVLHHRVADKEVVECFDAARGAAL